MKLKITYNTNHDDFGNQTMIAESNGKKIEIFQREFYDCAEDALFFRDLTPPLTYVDVIKMAYDAGKAGEPFEYEFTQINDEDL